MNPEPMQFDHDDDLNATVASLSKGDKVRINDRSIPLKVFDTDSECIGSNSEETLTVYLEGRGGRVYRLRGEYGHKANLRKPDDTPPSLELRQEAEWEMKTSAVWSIGIEGDQQILSDTTAGEWLEEVGIDVR
ncbi:hypothetical protein [Natronorubrum texcoconense]|uniref:Uncharacterized protein n=1 Tax=Natronorubrum texcoconense TaxID=1095776 RepID=A0A1G9HAA9_9EURY|nr:hypothetical protein [Natronorubrum texcoconense]SDL09860.1 hypothetical protein SAMN04515672_0169 [Natronorubrum texcoconense]